MTGSTIAYAERLRVPARWWLIGGLMAASFWIAMAVALPLLVLSILTAVLALVLVTSLVWYGAVRLRVADGFLEAGRARIAVSFLGDVEALDRRQMREISGPRADARAYLILRPYVAGGVRVALEDPLDPTPYWLVSSRRPAALAAALSAEMAVNLGQP